MGNVMSPLQALGCHDWAKYVFNSCHCKSQCCHESLACSVDTDEVSVASSDSQDKSLWNHWGSIR